MSEPVTTEKNLQDSYTLYRSIIDVLEEGITVQHADSTIIACNNSAERILGLTAAQMEGRSSLDPRWRAIHEDGSPFPGDTHPAMVTLATGKPCLNVIMGVHKPDDTLSWISINSQPLFRADEEKPYGVVCSFTDITHRKQSERELQNQRDFALQVMNSMGQGLTITNFSNEFIFVNSAYATMLGYQPEELLGKRPRDLANPADHPALDKARLQRSTGSSANYEVRLIRKDGSELYALVVGVPRWEEGKVVGTIAVTTDLTEQKRLERMKSEFIATVSHELRTPLTSIRGALSLLVGGAVGEIPTQALTMLEVAHNNSGRLVSLINDIVDIERIEDDKLSFNMQPLDLLPLVQKAIEANQPYAQQFGVDFLLSAEPLDFKVNGDSDRLTQALTNLLSNAAKFSLTDSEVMVNLTTNNRTVRVSVVDKGVGIPDEFRSRVFQKFAQADSSATRQRGGAGLGLHITKSIIEKHGGTINFDSKLNVGSTFYFDLPLWKPLDHLGNNGVNPLVLICEDDPDIASLLSLILRDNGFDSNIARDAAQVRLLLKHRKYAAMTLDMHLPDQSGLSLLKELRENEDTKTLPVVVVSVNSVNDLTELGGNVLSIIDWVEKPIDHDRLVNAVRQATATLPQDSLPLILHIEDEPDIRAITAAILLDVAKLEFAESLQEAQEKLAAKNYNLILLDLALPDGSGLDLLPTLSKYGYVPPVVIFSAHEVDNKISQQVAAALTKSRTSNQELIATIHKLVGK